jgi:hypothetical protein
MAVVAARLPMPGEHSRRMLAASLWYLHPGCPGVPLLQHLKVLKIRQHRLFEHSLPIQLA